MRKSARLFEIIQILRLARAPVTAADLGAALEVSPRSVYRDIAALQAMRVPIDGGRGIGYILRPGFNLPPLMFSVEEAEAVVLALALLSRTGEPDLQAAARRVNDKIAAAVPAPLRQTFAARSLHAWGTVPPAPGGVDLAMIRRAVRDEQKISLTYADAQGQTSERTVRPIALIYYSATSNIVGWCELRQALRNFRSDRVIAATLLPDRFIGQGDALRRDWIAGWRT